MKNIKIIILTVMMCVVMSSVYAESTLTIRNHYGSDLNFQIQKGEEYTKFSSSFLVAANGETTTKIKKSKEYCENGIHGSESVLISVTDNNSSSAQNSAFFGVGRGCKIHGDHEHEKKVFVNGYQDYGIAYDWEDGRNATVTFCQPEVYHQNGNKCP